MPTQDDIRFAKIILKKEWLPKETLEKALKEVEKIRQHDPKINLPDYLGLKEMLDWEKIEWAMDVIAASQAKAAAEAGEQPPAPRVRAAGRGHPGGVRGRLKRPPARGRRGAVSRGHAGVRHGGDEEDNHVFHRRQKSSAPMAVGLGLAACALIVVVGYFFFGSESGSGSSKTGKGGGDGAAAPKKEVPYEEQLAFEGVEKASGDIRQRIKLAEDFLVSYPQSIHAGEVRRRLQKAKNDYEMAAQTEWQTLQGEFDTYFSQHKYSDLMDKLRSFGEKFTGTPPAEAARSKIEVVDQKWTADSNDKFQAIDLLVTEGRFDEAISECETLLTWCSRGLSSLVSLKIDDIKQKKTIDVASADTGSSGSRKKLDIGELNVGELETGEIDPGEEETGPEGAGEEEIGQEKSGGGEELPPGLFPGDDEIEEGIGGGKDEEEEETGGEIDPGSGEIDPSGEEIDPSGEESLFGEGTTATSGAMKNHPLIRAIKKEGLEKVQKEIERLFVCSQVKVLENGQVKIAYNFSTRDDRLARDWTPRIGRKPSDNIRWSVDWEGGIVRVFYGVRISDNGIFLGAPCFTHEFDVEVYYHSAQKCSAKSHIIAGVYDEKSKSWYGSNFGSMAVRADSAGRIKKAKGRREVPEAENIRWFRTVFKGTTIKSYLALAGGKGLGLRVGPEFDKLPNYRATGELEIDKELKHVKPGVVFHPDIVGTIGYVRVTGYLDPEWLRDTAKEKGCKLDFDVIDLGV